MEGELQDKIQSLLSDPESMQQIAELAQMFQGETEQAAPAGMPDAAMLMQIGQMMQSGGEDKNTALLTALRPHLSARRQERTDKAVRLLKLWAVVRSMQSAGLLQDLI